jgi:hypothetical protein
MADSIPNWGICAKTESNTKRQKGKVTGVLRRCDENCRDFKLKRETAPVQR